MIASCGQQHRARSWARMPARGVWAWDVVGDHRDSALGDGPQRTRAGTRGHGPVRSLLVCGLLLLTLPVSSTDFNMRQPVQGRSLSSHVFARENVPAGRTAAPLSVLPAFAGGWGGHVMAKAVPMLCIRTMQARLAAKTQLMAMVSTQPRTGSTGEARALAQRRLTDASAIASGVNASFKQVISTSSSVARRVTDTPDGTAEDKMVTPVRRRRGIGSRMGANTAKRASTSIKASSSAAAKASASARKMGRKGVNAAGLVGGEEIINKEMTDEYLNEDALLRQAARQLVKEHETRRLLAQVDDMAGGARIGRAPIPKKAPMKKSRLSSYVGNDFADVEEEQSLTDAIVDAQEAKEEYREEFSEDVESDWEAQKRFVAKPQGAQGRWRSRLRSMRPESESTEFSVLETEYVEEVAAQRDLVNQELMRKVTILTKGRAQGVASPQISSHGALSSTEQERELFLNPGFIEQRREENERAAKEGGLTSGVALAELGRRGLVGRSKSSQDMHRGASAVEFQLDLGGAVFDLQVVHDVLYTAGSDNCVTMYDTKTWEKTGVLKGHKAWVNAMVIDEKRNLLYTASDDTTVIVWDVKTQERIQTLKGHNEGAISLQLLGSKLVVGCTGRIMVWDTKSWKLVDELTQHTQVLRAMSDGKQMSKMLGIDPRIVIAREAAKLVGQKIGGIASSKHYMFSAVDEGSIWVWEKRHLEVERKLLGPQGVNMDPVWVRSLEVIELPHPTTGRLCLKLLSGWADGALRVYNLDTWTLEHTLAAHSGPILSLAVVGNTVITTGADTTAAEWDPTTWTLNRVLRNHDGAVCSATGLADGRVLTASLDGILKVWKSEEEGK